jgi:hypothetical protein
VESGSSSYGGTMPLSNAIESYADCRNLLDRALDSPKGVKVTLQTDGQAIRLNHRCNKFRVLDRQQNAKLYPEGNEWHNTSVYDGLCLSRSGAELSIIRLEKTEMEVEELE